MPAPLPPSAAENAANLADALEALDGLGLKEAVAKHEAARDVAASRLAAGLRTWAGRHYRRGITEFCEDACRAAEGDTVNADTYRQAIYGRHGLSAFPVLVAHFRRVTGLAAPTADEDVRAAA